MLNIGNTISKEHQKTRYIRIFHFQFNWVNLFCKNLKELIVIILMIKPRNKESTDEFMEGIH